MSGPYLELGADARLRLSAGGAALLDAAGTACCCGGSGGANPCANNPSSIAIYNYTDSYFSACPDCAPALAGDCVWDGTFQVFDSAACAYTNGQCFSGANGCYCCDFDGVRLWEFSPPGISRLWYDSSSNTFFMQIVCQNGSNSGQIVWQGSKAGGGTFSGAYNRTGGCAGVPATVQIA